VGGAILATRFVVLGQLIRQWQWGVKAGSGGTHRAGSGGWLM
jgi:hypothetical protein